MGRRKRNKHKMVNTNLGKKELTCLMISCDYNDKTFNNFKVSYIDEDYSPTKLFFSDKDPVIAWKKSWNYCVKKVKERGFKKIIVGETVDKWIGKSDYQLEPDHNGTQVLVKHDFVF